MEGITPITQWCASGRGRQPMQQRCNIAANSQARARPRAGAAWLAAGWLADGWADSAGRLVPGRLLAGWLVAGWLRATGYGLAANLADWLTSPARKPGACAWVSALTPPRPRAPPPQPPNPQKAPRGAGAPPGSTPSRSPARRASAVGALGRARRRRARAGGEKQN
jgi:hypothetical protein